LSLKEMPQLYLSYVYSEEYSWTKSSKYQWNEALLA